MAKYICMALFGLLVGISHFGDKESLTQATLLMVVSLAFAVSLFLAVRSGLSEFFDEALG